MLLIRSLALRLKRGKKTFNKYYSKTDNLPFYAIALILYLNYYIKYIKAN